MKLAQQENVRLLHIIKNEILSRCFLIKKTRLGVIVESL